MTRDLRGSFVDTALEKTRDRCFVRLPCYVRRNTPENYILCSYRSFVVRDYYISFILSYVDLYIRIAISYSDREHLFQRIFFFFFLMRYLILLRSMIGLLIEEKCNRWINFIIQFCEKKMFWGQLFMRVIRL